MNQCTNLLTSIRREMRRELHSLEHASAWAQYEKLLMYRANFMFLTKLIYMVAFAAIGKANY